jgi:hypothetical protein
MGRRGRGERAGKLSEWGIDGSGKGKGILGSLSLLFGKLKDYGLDWRD